MADYSISSYTADGTTTDFLLTFDYLDVTHLKVFIDGVSADDVGAGYAYSLIDATTMRVTTDILDPVTSGKLIEIKRVTPIDNPAVTFNDGSSINGGDLNKNTNYLLFAMQESVDNIHETVAEGAALAQVATEGFRDEAEAFRDQAATSAANAAASAAGVTADTATATTAATNAASSATAASSSASAASTSATNAASSASAASTSATAAATSATSASSSASSAGTSATNAAASATSAGNSATSATSSASSASSSASSATTSKNAAATSATNAASSASAAASSATAAGTSATNAASSATSASTSATNAATSAAEAAASAASLGLDQGVSTTDSPTFAGGTFTGTVTADGLTVDTSTLVVDSTNNRVGIGEAAPEASLHITTSSGDTVLILEADPTNTNENDTPYIIFRADGSTGESAVIGLVGNSGDHATGSESNALILEATGSKAVQIAPGSSVSAHFDPDGNVGIGTTSPSSKLHVNGDSTFGGAITEGVYNLTGTALDPSNGTIQTKTLSANTTFTDSLSAGESITLMIDDGTAYTITWPTMTWVNNAGAAPTLATSGYTVVALWKVGSTLYGALVGDGS